MIVFDDLTTGQQAKVPEGATLVVGDVTDTTALEAVFSGNDVDAVVHCAAKKAVGESEAEPELYFRNNVFGTLNLLSAMAEHNVPKIVFSSTAAVYDPAGQIPFTEASSLAPASVYGSSKLLSETLITEFARTGKLKEYVILRYFNVAGDAGLMYREDSAQNVFPLLARALENDAEFKQFGNDYDTRDGTGVRDYIHLADLVDAHLAALSGDVSGTFNLGTGTGYSVRELIQAFEAATGRTMKVVEVPRRPGDVGTVVADASRAREQLGWEPKRTLEEMVKSTVVVYGI